MNKQMYNLHKMTKYQNKCDGSLFGNISLNVDNIYTTFMTADYIPVIA